MNRLITATARYFSLIAVLTGCLVASGCASAKPKPWTVSIVKKTTATIPVDIMGVSESDKPAWESYNLDKYWQEGDVRRKQADKLSFNLQKDKPVIFKSTDPKWLEWLNSGATELLVIANLPEHFDPSGDPRRLFVPLSKKAWNSKNDTLEFEIWDTMIKCRTPRNR